ncbi:MAG: type II secretion system protein [Candidatus Komeilibacteria bacterium]|nr:type II secretion system protein [Candidatus Komeilibacteria bacterium]
MRKNKYQALTLIELLVAIGILGITISMAATFIKFQQPNLELSAAARDLRSTLQRARLLSLTTQINHGVLFLAAQNSYQTVRLAPSPATLNTTVLPLSVQYITIDPFTANIASFNAAGAAAAAGTIVLRNTQNREKRIILNPSGYVSIE